MKIFHIPGFWEYYELNKRLLQLIEEKEYYFKSDFKIGSIYGSFPNFIWNGGRTVFGMQLYIEEMKEIVDYFNNRNIPVRFTFTNSMINETHLYDTLGNQLLKNVENNLNEILVNNQLLEDYIRKNYPKFKFISSTTKGLNEDELKAELNKDYKLVVLDYTHNNEWEYIDKFDNLDKLEILVNEVCIENCPIRKQHYDNLSKQQINFSRKKYKCKFKEKELNDFHTTQKRKHFVSNDLINTEYIPRGIVNFKIEGRGAPVENLIESYIYYFVKEEYKDRVRFLLTRLDIKLPEEKEGKIC